MDLKFPRSLVDSVPSKAKYAVSRHFKSNLNLIFVLT